MRRDQYLHAQEVEQALLEETDYTEREVSKYRQRRDEALSAVVCTSPEFLHLYKRQAELWIELRSVRLCMLAVNNTVGSGLSHELLSLAQVSENVSDRRTGYAVDEALIDTWVTAVQHLGQNADAPLPDPASPTGSNGNSGTGTNSNVGTPDRGAEHRPAPRRGARGAATPLSRRPGRSQRRGGKTAGMPVRRRASLARERDPTTGKWLPREKAVEQTPPPE